VCDEHQLSLFVEAARHEPKQPMPTLTPHPREHLKEGEERAKADQEKAEQYFRSWVARYIDDVHPEDPDVVPSKLMNISSTDQIRQLLFPDACVQGGVRTFKALNPKYEEVRTAGIRSMYPCGGRGFCMWQAEPVAYPAMKTMKKKCKAGDVHDIHNGKRKMGVTQGPCYVS